MSLSTKYRPRSFKDVVGQDITVSIIERGIRSNKISHSLIYVGPAGTGKTTNARITAEVINGVQDSYIEIDAASHNSVDDVREIIETANERSISFKYKIYIIDECHMLSTQAWNAMLKLIEEPSSYTMFIFCTTDAQKIPQTIISRCQVFRFNRISDLKIKERLKYICGCENIKYEELALDYISKMADGGMRQAITYLDKCKDFSDVVTTQAVKDVLGDCSYDIMFDLTNAVIDGNKTSIIDTIEDLHMKGTDLKLFMSKYLEFVLQLSKYCALKTIECTTIPSAFRNNVEYTVNIENSCQWFNAFLERILKIKQSIKNDNDVKTTIEVMLLSR